MGQVTVWGHCVSRIRVGASERAGRNWSGVDLPLSLQPRLPHDRHCHFSSLCALPAIALVRGPKGPNPYLPGWGQGCGLRAFGFYRLVKRCNGDWGVADILCCMFQVACTSGVLACAGLSWPHSLCSGVTRGIKEGGGGLRIPRKGKGEKGCRRYAA